MEAEVGTDRWKSALNVVMDLEERRSPQLHQAPSSPSGTTATPSGLTPLLRGGAAGEEGRLRYRFTAIGAESVMRTLREASKRSHRQRRMATASSTDGSPTSYCRTSSAARAATPRSPDG